ncbi:hypothetical protein [Methylobacterium isbiliense]|jgi:hypothetical protein|uniref:Uncharacterized protein n=1 Tax=Methylobacterium isbiliense TaxID=315478 RepID=A0ABQ4SNS7_9HYPH|nr:hypothetical protein [Methylobacterium isbiliense]MDN3626545.1 hypothetical protein [Methylobacterium isbiliense]GJE03946.1 hypothetical protein GMJLKIPL_5903 [Methylobacterium isbiliense]
MSHSDTDRPDADETAPSRALTVIETPQPAACVPARPLATFLVQLIDGPAGSLRPSRLRRSREASERYAAGARRLG